MNVCDERLQTGIELVTSEDMETLEQEMNLEKPHEFSKEFEQKMETLLNKSMPKRKSTCSIPRYMAAAAAAVVVIGGFGVAGGAKLYASETNIPILQWMENFFVTEHDTDQMKGEKSIEVLFSQDQIGYLPEGFELVEEVIRESKVSYIYKNDSGKHIILEIYQNKMLTGIDNMETNKKVHLNESGLEYYYVYKEDSCKHIFEWLDEAGKLYLLSGEISKEELQAVMNGIFY